MYDEKDGGFGAEEIRSVQKLDASPSNLLLWCLHIKGLFLELTQFYGGLDNW